MIVNKEKKIVILLTPKTGSTTIRSIFKKDLVTSYGSHATYHQAVEYLEEEGYRFFAFCRDPIDRALSATTMATFSYIQLDPNRAKVQEFIDKIFPEKKMIAPAVAESDSDRSGLQAFYRENIGTRAMPSLLLTYNNPPTFAGLVPQTTWLDNPAVKILRYEQYEDNVRMLCDLMGVSISEIPRTNKSESRLRVSVLPQKEVDFIKEYYDKDYRLLRSRGIIY